MSEVSIEYEPFKKIVIMECTMFPIPAHLACFTSIVARGKPSGVYWAQDLAFLYFPLPVNRHALKER